MAILIVQPEEGEERRVELTKPETLIGRSPEAQITLEDDAISGMHCSLVRTGDRYILRDLNSTNGTYLNEAPITETRLQDGDVIEVGGARITFEAEPTPADAGGPQPTRRTRIPGGPQAFNARRDTRRIWTIVMIAAILAVIGALAWYVTQILPD